MMAVASLLHRVSTVCPCHVPPSVVCSDARQCLGTSCFPFLFRKQVVGVYSCVQQNYLYNVPVQLFKLLHFKLVFFFTKLCTPYSFETQFFCILTCLKWTIGLVMGVRISLGLGHFDIYKFEFTEYLRKSITKLCRWSGLRTWSCRPSFWSVLSSFSLCQACLIGK